MRCGCVRTSLSQNGFRAIPTLLEERSSIEKGKSDTNRTVSCKASPQYPYSTWYKASATTLRGYSIRSLVTGVRLRRENLPKMPMLRTKAKVIR